MNCDEVSNFLAIAPLNGAKLTCELLQFSYRVSPLALAFPSHLLLTLQSKLISTQKKDFSFKKMRSRHFEEGALHTRDRESSSLCLLYVYLSYVCSYSFTPSCTTLEGIVVTLWWTRMLNEWQHWRKSEEDKREKLGLIKNSVSWRTVATLTHNWRELEPFKWIIAPTVQLLCVLCNFSLLLLLLSMLSMESINLSSVVLHAMPYNNNLNNWFSSFFSFISPSCSFAHRCSASSYQWLIRLYGGSSKLWFTTNCRVDSLSLD